MTMDKMTFESWDMTQKNIEKIAALFPGVVTEAVDAERSTEGKVVLKKAINFPLLKQLLSDDVVDGEECYEFTWVGKKQAIVEANRPIRKTLRPCPQESKNWDTTENLYIEGDNLEVLKLLQESYLGKVKMIYIDPPYNTGKDFVYRDNFRQSKDEYDEEAGVYDDEDNRLIQNTESNGRFHSDWCSMMYSRLVIARNILASDGAIYVSIDDGEQANLRKLCDDVFGEDNFVANVIWEKKYTRSNDARWFSDNHDHILVYMKNKDETRLNLLSRSETQLSSYSNPDNNPKGVWKATPLHAKSGTSDAPYTFRNGVRWVPPAGTFRRFSDETMHKMDLNNEIWFGADMRATPSRKSFLCDVKNGVTPVTIWPYGDVGHSHEANSELAAVMTRGLFDNPKPTRLIKRMLELSARRASQDIILDFFSGSATTAHAVMQLNAEDGGNRKFIMVQLPEACAEDSEAFKAGYKNICEIGKERIRRAGEKIRAEIERQNAQGSMVDEPKKLPDIGFRVLKLDESNMRDVYYAPAEYNQNQLDMFASNIRPDRTDMDLLYGCLLEWGLPLLLPHTCEQIGGAAVHTVNGGDLIACFADEISEAVVREIAARQPLRAVFRDSSFASSPDKINVAEIFKLLAPDTRVKVI